MFQKSNNLIRLNESESSEFGPQSFKKTRRTSLPKNQFEESKQYDNDLTNVKYDYRGAESSRVTQNNQMSECNDQLDTLEFINDDDSMRKQSNTVIEQIQPLNSEDE